MNQKCPDLLTDCSSAQALVFEKANYGGERFQVSRDVSDLQQQHNLSTVGSIKVLGGL